MPLLSELQSSDVMLIIFQQEDKVVKLGKAFRVDDTNWGNITVDYSRYMLILVTLVYAIIVYIIKIIHIHRS